MGNRKSKPMSEGRSVKALQVFPQDTNHHHTMFGGTMMANIDQIAAITAMKHSNAQVVTASTDSVDFLKPIKQEMLYLTKRWSHLQAHHLWKYVYKL